MDTEGQQALVQEFCGITSAPEDFARMFLNDTGWNLEASVNAYMAVLSDDGPAPPAVSAPAPRVTRDEDEDYRMASEDEEEELQRAMEASTRGIKEPMGEAEGGDSSLPPAGALPQPSLSANGKAFRSESEETARPSARRGATQPRWVESAGGPSMEATRNFAAEGMPVPMSAMSRSTDTSMESLFPPPAALMFHGTFDVLRRNAEEQQKYCLVNIQKDDVFASHELNRDTWKFVFWQQKCVSLAGQQYLAVYPSLDLPVVDIVDPMTGALLDRITGYKPPDEMAERLSRFLDSHTWGRMGKAISTQQSLSMSQAQYHAIEGPGGADKRSRMSLEHEDAALDAAIAASLQDRQDSSPPDGCIDEDVARIRRQRSDPAPTPHTAYSDSLRVAQEMEFEQALQEDEEKERVRRQAEDEEALELAVALSRQDELKRILSEKEAALPAEPDARDAGVAALVLRLPDGSRKQRRFRGSDKLQVVLDFMHLNGADPALHTVAMSFPRKVLDDADKTLEELGLGGHQTMLNVETK